MPVYHEDPDISLGKCCVILAGKGRVTTMIGKKIILRDENQLCVSGRCRKRHTEGL